MTIPKSVNELRRSGGRLLNGMNAAEWDARSWWLFAAVNIRAVFMHGCDCLCLWVFHASVCGLEGVFSPNHCDVCLVLKLRFCSDSLLRELLQIKPKML